MSATATKVPGTAAEMPPWVVVGRHSFFGEAVQLRTWTPEERIVIGSFCSVADGASIMTGGHHRSDLPSTFPFDYYFLGRRRPHRTYMTTPDTTLGNDVWVGQQASICGGARVGSGAVVANRAVVMSDVPAYAVVAGNPARVVRYRFSRPVIERLERIAWWDWPDEVIRQHVEWFYRPIQEFCDRFDPPAEERARLDG